MRKKVAFKDRWLFKKGDIKVKNKNPVILNNKAPEYRSPGIQVAGMYSSCMLNLPVGTESDIQSSTKGGFKDLLPGLVCRYTTSFIIYREKDHFTNLSSYMQ